jgi:hypothetical protein
MPKPLTTDHAVRFLPALSIPTSPIVVLIFKGRLGPPIIPHPSWKYLLVETLYIQERFPVTSLKKYNIFQRVTQDKPSSVSP